MIEQTEIRPAAPKDYEAIFNVLTSAFEQDDEARRLNALRDDNAITRELVAVFNDNVIGYCAFSRVSASPALPENPLLLGMAPVAVSPEFQNRGIGRRLINNGLQHAKNDNAAMVVVVGAPEYYSRFGFEPGRLHHFTWAAMDAGDAFLVIVYNLPAEGRPRTISYHPAFS